MATPNTSSRTIGIFVLLAIGAAAWFLVPRVAPTKSAANLPAAPAFKRPTPPPQVDVGEEKYKARRVIELCWSDYERKSIDPGSKLFVASVCEKLEADFRAKYHATP